MAIDQNQSTTTEHVETPIDRILDGDRSAPEANRPDQTQASETQPPADGSEETSFEREARTVPLAALRAERERRRKADREIEALRAKYEAEFQKFDDQRFGIPGEGDEADAWGAPVGDLNQPGEEPQQLPPVREAGVQSMLKFTEKHGQQRFAAMDAAYQKLPQADKEVCAVIARLVDDPAETLHDFLVNRGVLEAIKHKPPGLDQIFADKAAKFNGGEQPATETPPPAPQPMTSNPAYIANFAASRAEFTSEHGKAAFQEIDAITDQLQAANHPLVPMLAQAVQTSSDPVAAAADILQRNGFWQPPEPEQQPQRQPFGGRVMPSNFAGARNVGSRTGPGWSGPPSLKSIFKDR